MAKCLNLTKTGEYAIAALSRLALKREESRPDPKPVSIQALAREQNIPLSFLSKIMARCVKAGILQSRRGPEGGITLKRPAEELSLLSIIEACEGNYRRESCVFYSSRRCDGPDCGVYCPLREKEEDLRSGLDRVTLAEMAGALGKHPYSKAGEAMEGFDGHRGRG